MIYFEYNTLKSYYKPSVEIQITTLYHSTLGPPLSSVTKDDKHAGAHHLAPLSANNRHARYAKMREKGEGEREGEGASGLPLEPPCLPPPTVQIWIWWHYVSVLTSNLSFKQNKMSVCPLVSLTSHQCGMRVWRVPKKTLLMATMVWCWWIQLLTQFNVTRSGLSGSHCNKATVGTFTSSKWKNREKE